MSKSARRMKRLLWHTSGLGTEAAMPVTLMARGSKKGRQS